MSRLLLLLVLLAVTVNSLFYNRGYLFRRRRYVCSARNGGWSNFGSWSTCKCSGQSGTQTRTRRCNSPTPSCRGAACSGSHQETGRCDGECCPVTHGGWQDIGELICSCEADGSGTWYQMRTCTNPRPSCGGRDCVGDHFKAGDHCYGRCTVYPWHFGVLSSTNTTAKRSLN